MSVFVKASGFGKKTLVDIQIELEASFQATFGNDIDLSSEGPFGQIIGLLSFRESLLWEGAQEIYSSRNVNAATGTSLDFLSAETGVRRIDSSATQVQGVNLFGTLGTTIPSNAKARVVGADLTYSLLDPVTISNGNLVEVTMDLVSPDASGGQIFSFVVNTGIATTFSYTTAPSDTKDIVIDALILDIQASYIGLGGQNKGGGKLRLFRNKNPFALISQTLMTPTLYASPGTFIADEDGPNSLPANALTFIVTPHSGWSAITNPVAGDTGREVETDDELRIRRASTFLLGKSTEEAILSAVFNEVEGVQAASITSNRTMINNIGIGGLPPKSFEVIISGGTPEDIANTIWKAMPAGIEAYGNLFHTILDSQGNPQMIHWSAPQDILIWVKVKRAFYSEEDYPINGDVLVKKAIVEWASTEFILDKDVIRQRLSIPIYSVPGIGEIEISLDSSIDPLHIPSYALVDIPITSRQISRFDVLRITVEAL